MSSRRTSPPAERVVAVVDHLARRPGERAGLSELARAVGLSKPTCLGILTTLTARGWLTCDPLTTSYGLGPALVALGAAARRECVPQAAADLAGERLAALADRYGATCTASAVVGDEIVLLAAVAPGGARPPVTPGRRYPFAPPVGLMYVLWDDDVVFERWLRMPPTLPVRVDGAHLRQVVAECRERGYLVEALTEDGRRLHTLLAGIAAHDLPADLREIVGALVGEVGERVYTAAELTGRTRRPVSLLAAPTYDLSDRQSLVLTLDVGTTLTAAEIDRRGRALAAVADGVSATIRGRGPDRWPPLPARTDRKAQ